MIVGDCNDGLMSRLLCVLLLCGKMLIVEVLKVVDLCGEMWMYFYWKVDSYLWVDYVLVFLVLKLVVVNGVVIIFDGENMYVVSDY